MERLLPKNCDGGLQDISPLEMHHVAGSFMAAQDLGARADIFQDMQPADRATLRANMIDLILGETC